MPHCACICNGGSSMRSIVRSLALSLVLTAFECTITSHAVAQCTPLPTGSPDGLPDVPPTPPGASPFPFFDNYSWRSFIALNWPALTDPQHRGEPDRARSFGDTSGPRVWQTWKSQIEIFQRGGAQPSLWTSYDGKNPCGLTISNQEITLSA